MENNNSIKNEDSIEDSTCVIIKNFIQDMTKICYFKNVQQIRGFLYTSLPDGIVVKHNRLSNEICVLNETSTDKFRTVASILEENNMFYLVFKSQGYTMY